MKGHMKQFLKAFQELADFYRANDKGVIAISASPDGKDPTLVHDLQIFADNDGFKSHADQENIPQIKTLF